MRELFIICLLFFTTATARGDGFDEVNAWRKHVGLPTFKEDPRMTEFALKKARYRASRDLQNGHQGPKAPPGWIEGTGEATPDWGFLACAIECDFEFVGAALVMGTNGLRYMVFVGRGGSGRPLISSHNIPIVDTSRLTPNPEVVKSPR